MESLKAINKSIITEYLLHQKIDLVKQFIEIKKISLSPESFTFYNAVSAMSSSKIEGESLEIDSYLKHKTQKVQYVNSLVQKPNDLYNTYEFAQKNELSKKNVLKSHSLISKHLLKANYRGKIRTSDMIIRDGNNGQIVYEACLKEKVIEEFDVFFTEVELLLKQNLSMEETFFYGSLIHLVFAKIHPFDDGNGRTARLLEKWFVAQKLGANAWFIQSELNYWNNKNEYYASLSKVGFFYDKLNYNKSIGFLLLLPKSLNN